MFKELGTAMYTVEDAFKTIVERGVGFDDKAIQSLANSVSSLTARQQAYVVAAQTGNDVLARQVLEANGLTESQINAAMATLGLANSTKELTAARVEEILTAQTGDVQKSKEIAQTLGLVSARETEMVSLEHLTYAQLQAKLTAQGLTQEQAILVATALGYSGAIDGETLAVNNLTFAELSAKMTQIGLNDEQIKGIGTALGLSSAATADAVSINNLSYATLSAKLSQAGLNTEQIKAIAVQLGYTGVIKGTTVAATGLGFAFKGLITTVKSLSLAIKAFILSHPILTAIAAAITAVIIAWKSYSKEQERFAKVVEEANEKERERRETLKGEVEELQSITNEYEELSKQTELTADEKSRLAELQNKLNKLYNTESEGIDLVNGKYDEQIDKLKTLNAEKQREYVVKTRVARRAAYRETNSNATDELLDKDIAKAFSKEFEDHGFYFDFVDEITKLGMDGIVAGLSSISLSDNMNAEEKVKALKAIRDALDKVTTEAQKDTDSFVLLNNKIDTLLEGYEKEVDDYTTLLDEEVRTIVDNFTHNGTDVTNAIGVQGLEWKEALIEQWAKDDPQLQKAINDYYYKVIFPAVYKGNEELAERLSFDWSTFADENGLEDIEKLLGKIQTAYKNLEETGNGFALDSDILNAFPELAEHLDDVDALKTKLQELSDAQMQPLIDQLKEIQSTLDPTSTDYSSIENIIKWLQQQADVTQKVKEKTQKTSDLYKEQKLQIHENIQALEREVKTIDKQISALEKKKDLQEKYIKTLEKEKDRLEDLIDDYETAASTVKDFIDEQNDALEKQKDNIEDTYGAQIKAIEETYDKQVKLLEAQEEGFDKQIKALQDEADEQDRLNDLKEKELALERAKNEKVRVYDSSKGWIITENSEETSKKRKELEEAQRENKIAKLEKEKERLESEKERLQAEKEQRTSELESIRDKEIETLQAEMDKLKEYKKAWEEAIAAYKKAQDEMTTAAILGADWRTKLAEQDKTIIEDYKNGYEGVQNQLNNSVIPMIELANKELDTYSEQIDKLKEQKDLYKNMEDNQKKYLDFYKTYAEQFATATKEQSDAVEALNKALATNTLLTNMDNTDKALDWVKSLFDEDYIREYPDYNGGKTASSGGLIGRLTDIFNKSTSVYDSFIKSMPDLLNKTSSDLSGQVMAGAKMIAETVTNNKSNNDNRTQTININNPGFALTETAFMAMLTTVFAKMNQESQIGKK